MMEVALNQETVEFWLNVSRYLSIVGYVLTLFFNVLLIVLTGWYIRRKLGTYKYLIIIFSVIGIAFNSLNIIVMPMVQSFRDGFIYFTIVESVFLSQKALTRLLAIYSSSYYVSSSFLAVMFIHRYFSVAKPEQLFYFQQKRIALWLSYSFFIGFLHYLSVIYFAEVDNYTKVYMAEKMFATYKQFIEDIPARTLIVYDDSSNVRWRDVYVLSHGLVLVLIQNMIIVYCGYRIRRKLYSKNTTYSASLRKLHSQFFKTLIFQVATPTILLFIPTILILYLPLLGCEMNFPTGIMLGLFGLYPAIDSCIVMYIIGDYQLAMKDFINDARRLILF